MNLKDVEVIDLSTQKEVLQLVRLLRRTKEPSMKEVIREKIRQAQSRDLGKVFLVDTSKIPYSPDIKRLLEDMKRTGFSVDWERD